MVHQDWHGPNKFVAALPALIALVITASVTDWRDFRIAMVAIPAASILIALVAVVVGMVLPRSREARYWYEFTLNYFLACLVVGFIALYAWLNSRYEFGWGGLLVMMALMTSVSWLVYDRIREWRRQHSAPGEVPEAEEARGQAEIPATHHAVKITVKGRGRDRRVHAQCHNCGWQEQHTGRGNWPDRRVAKLAAEHTRRQ